MSFEGLKKYIDALPTVYDVKSCDISVRYKHKEFFRHSIGYSDVECTKPTDLQWIYSMTKEPLGFEPGENYCYSLSHDVLAMIAEVISGKIITIFYATNYLFRLE